MPGIRRPSFFLTLLAVLIGGFALSACGGSSDEEPEGWEGAPIVPELTGKLKQRFMFDVAIANGKGYSPDVFAKVGDSNTEFPQNLYGFGCRTVQYGDYEDLEPVVEKYSRLNFIATSEPGCDPTNSFSRLSAATRAGTYSVFPVSKIRDSPIEAYRPDPGCDQEEIPLDCEIRIMRPRYTIVMTGTNDLGLDANYSTLRPGSQAASRLAFVIERIRRTGSVPILSNLPPSYVPQTPDIDEYGGIKLSNERIADLAKSQNVPLINLWRALEEDQMINRGLGKDGVHLSVFGGDDSPDIFANSVNLTEEALKYGANRRNLIWLQVLDALDQVADSAR